MPDITNADIMREGAGVEGDYLEKIDRIVTGINKLYDAYNKTKAKQPASAPATESKAPSTPNENLTTDQVRAIIWQAVSTVISRLDQSPVAGMTLKELYERHSATPVREIVKL